MGIKSSNSAKVRIPDHTLANPDDAQIVQTVEPFFKVPGGLISGQHLHAVSRLPSSHSSRARKGASTSHATRLTLANLGGHHGSQNNKAARLSVLSL